MDFTQNRMALIAPHSAAADLGPPVPGTVRPIEFEVPIEVRQPGGCTAFRSHSNINMLSHPVQLQVPDPPRIGLKAGLGTLKRGLGVVQVRVANCRLKTHCNGR